MLAAAGVNAFKSTFVDLRLVFYDLVSLCSGRSAGSSHNINTLLCNVIQCPVIIKQASYLSDLIFSFYENR